MTLLLEVKDINPFAHGMGGRPPTPFFLPFTQISLSKTYLKILDLTKLFIADAPMKKKIKNFSFNPSKSTLKYGSKKSAHGRKG